MNISRKQKKEKCYCVDCFNYYPVGHCKIGVKDTPIAPEKIYGDCYELNANNNCERYICCVNQ